MKFTDSVENELIPGDIVRMYHFAGARNRKFYTYKRFIGYIENNGMIAARYQSLDDEEHFFSDVGNKLKNDILVVQRARNHDKDLKKNQKMRD